jgi:hypothetical protein
MSYRCEVCTTVVPKNIPRRTYCVKRSDGNIAHEYPVCGDCHFLLDLGLTLAEVTRRRRPKDPLAPIVVEAQALAKVEVAKPKVVVSALDRWRKKSNGDLAVQTPPPKRVRK